MERQLVKQIIRAKEKTEKVIVVYGGKFCNANLDGIGYMDGYIAENPELTAANLFL